jgi:signal transduction histidine kinase/ActR/RegA family two-component response regulator
MMSEQSKHVEAGKPDSQNQQRSRSSRLAAFVIVLATLAASGALAIVSHNVSKGQERTLLKERANEVSTLLSTAIGQANTVLNGAGAAAVSDPKSNIFVSLVAGSTLGGSEAVVAQQREGSFVTIARAGTGSTTVGSPIPPAAAETGLRALSSEGMVTGFSGSGSARHIILALAVKGTPQTVAYFESPLAPAAPTPTDPDSPYRELDAAIYAGPTASAEALVIVSGHKPSTGPGTVSKKFPVGAETWLLKVSAKEPLVGSLASAFPWLVLGAGTALALILGLLVEILIRRRAYALRLVDERTASLVEARLVAEKANKAKSDFLSRMSHELRTPLNAVLGFGQLLEMDGLSPDQAENVSQITKGGSHLLDLINEILDISQIESGHMSMSPEAVLVADVVEAAVSLLRPLAEERAVHLIGGRDQGCAHFIFADRQRVKQILLNLLGNGIKYNRQGGSVSISCFEPVRGTLRIQVTDTGPGISPEQFELLFQPFERLGAEQTSVPGTGVGLALSRGLAEAMGGRLDVESTPGRGSTFWVDFPIVESPVKIYEEANQRTARPVEAESDVLTVLHIEDNLANVQLVERVLAQRPAITVLPAMQGRMGVDLARRHHPILILLDLNLVDLPGAEVLKILRDDPLTANIPVAIISADAMPRQVQRLMSSGAVDYLTKPIDIHRLLKLVDDAVGAVSVPGGGPSDDPRDSDGRRTDAVPDPDAVG